LRTRLKEWFLRFALLAGSLLLLFGVLEITLRMLGYADPAERWDPFQGFEGTNPVYVLERRGGEEVIVPAPNKGGIIGTFAPQKPAGLIRIFAFGGSTTYGTPWNPHWAFSQRLEEILWQRHGVQAEVVNVSMSGHGSARVLEVMREVVHYDPDVLVVYAGQNEFRDARFHSKELTRPALWNGGLELLWSSRVAYLAYVSWLRAGERAGGRRITGFAAERIGGAVLKEYSAETFRSYEPYAVPELRPREAGPQGAGPVSGTPDEGTGSRVKEWIKRGLGERRWAELKWVVGRGAAEYEVYPEFRSNLDEMARLAEEARVPIVFMPITRNRKARSLITQPTVRADWIRDGKESEWRTHYEVGI
jgi:hypothetical protein